MSSNRVQWRRFAFFDKENIHENILTVVGAAITCADAEGGLLVFGDETGKISLADRNCKLMWQNVAYKGPVRGLAYIIDKSNQARQYIVAVGEDFFQRQDSPAESKQEIPVGPQYVVKVFNVQDMKRPLQAFNASPSLAAGAQLTTFSVLSDGTQIAIGFDTGMVLLVKGTFSRDGAVARLQPPHVLHQSHPSPVSGLHFCFVPAPGGEKAAKLFVVFAKGADSATLPEPDVLPATTSNAGILVFDTALRPDQKKPAVVLDERGANPLCSCLMKETNEVVVGRVDGVFAYSVEDRGGAAGFEGEKQCVQAVGRYILVASLDDRSQRTAITIYDVRNKFISLHHLLPQNDTARKVLADGDVAYVITSRWGLLRLKEKDTSSKLEVLLRKSLFPLAIALATEEQCDVTERLKLFKMYGDHLYKKCDFDGAIKQYSHTVGYVQSSYVIRRFLDTQRINNLTYYLEKLHEAGAASSDHTTLLLSCYTRMKDDEKLARFFDLGDETGEFEVKSKTSFRPKARVTFDVEVALKTLQEAGYHSHALKLARAHGEHDWYLKVQLERPDPDCMDALTYITELLFRLPRTEVVRYIKTYGRKILQHVPEEFVGLLAKLCTGSITPQEFGISELPSSPTKDGNSTKYSNSTPNGSSPTARRYETDGDKVQRMDPEEFMSVFTDQDKWLRVFLDTVHTASLSGALGRIPSSRVVNTLLELMLQERACLVQEGGEHPSSDAKAEIGVLEDRIMGLLDEPHAKYDEAHALLLVQMFNFRNGELFLLDRMESVDLLLRRYIECEDDRAIMRLLRREGRKLPDLYVLVLKYFVMSAGVRGSGSAFGVGQTGSEEDEEERWDRVAEVLALIESQQALPPVEVINILAQNPELPVSVASKYIKKLLHQESSEMSSLEADVHNMKYTVLRILQDAEKDLGHVQTKGPVAGRDDLQQDENDDDPDEEDEEDEISYQLRKWEEIRHAQLERAGDHEAFFKELEHSSDGFATVASFFGKAMLS